MGNDNISLGKASLWTSIVGIVLPVCLAVLVAIFLNRPVLGQDPGVAYSLCGLLFVMLELIALGCGIAARRTATGKAGLVIGLSALLLGLVVFALKMHSERAPAAAAGETASPLPATAFQSLPPSLVVHSGLFYRCMLLASRRLASP
jgi:hypothetical protein